MEKSITRFIVISLVVIFISFSSALAKEQQPLMKMLGSGTVKATLIVDGRKVPVSGRTSLYLEATEKEFSSGKIRVKGMNIAFFDVLQAMLTYEKIDPDRKGVLGFALDPERGVQYVAYDPDKGIIEGRLTGYLDADFMADGQEKSFFGEEDFVETPKQAGEIFFKMELKNAFAFKVDDEKIKRYAAALSADLKAYAEIRSDAMDYELVMENTPLEFEVVVTWFWEVARRIKIQPVRIGRWLHFPPWFFPLNTGAGLAFGLPQVREQWLKADVVVSVNDWQTVWDEDYWVMDATESGALRAEVNVADAIEVFFVHDLSPVCMWGMGATWGLGSAGSKIISSDGNARGGIDVTHLAHELGHSFGLPHPDGSPGVSTGTLMCPSGCLNDNPQINSQENKDNLTNPLFTFTFKPASAGPDCLDSADCGSCF
jgi:hypothetical protein